VSHANWPVFRVSYVTPNYLPLTRLNRRVPERPLNRLANVVVWFNALLTREKSLAAYPN
jgi:hypothetical protein